MSEDKIAANLFDQVKPAAENLKPKEFVSRPFHNESSVAHGLCNNCGVNLELNEQGANDFCKEAGVNPRVNYKEAYFTVDTCEICSDDCNNIKLLYIN